MKYNYIRYILLGILLLIIGAEYKFNNPMDSIYFPKCPFKQITGYKCPGCGSQRAIHYLLNLNIRQAFNENALLVLFIPYLILGYIFELARIPNKKILKWRKLLFGKEAIIFISIVIVFFWIFRNL